MDGFTSAEEHRAQCIEALGEKAGRWFDEIHQRVVWTSGVWTQHQQLFQKDRKTSLLLERNAGLFFHIVYEELWDSTLLWICKLLDEAKDSVGNRNLTLGTLVNSVSNPDLKSELDRRFEDLKVQSEIIRKQRRKRIAHLDRPYALKEERELRELVVAEQVNAVLGGMYEFLEIFRDNHGMARYGYAAMHWSDGADDLVKILWQVEQERWAHLEELGITPPQ